MTPTDLSALIVRVEALAGPDREVDAAIACMIGRPLGNIDHWLHGADITYRPTAWGYYVAVIPKHGTSEAFQSKEYTASIDAASSLVPEGWGWTLGDKAPEPSIAWCEIDHLPWHDGYGWAVERKLIVTAATPALALCAAALKARTAPVDTNPTGGDSLLAPFIGSAVP